MQKLSTGFSLTGCFISTNVISCTQDYIKGTSLWISCHIGSITMNSHDKKLAKHLTLRKSHYSFGLSSWLQLCDYINFSRIWEYNVACYEVAHGLLLIAWTVCFPYSTWSFSHSIAVAVLSDLYYDQLPLIQVFSPESNTIMSSHYECGGLSSSYPWVVQWQKNRWTKTISETMETLNKTLYILLNQSTSSDVMVY